MFNREKKALHVAEGNFNRCNLKKVQFKQVVLAWPSRVGFSKQRLYFSDEKYDKVGTVTHMGHVGILECPRTIDQGVNASTDKEQANGDKLDALDDLRRLAGDLVCRDCPYVDMTPADVSTQRAAFARAETERVEAFAIRMQAVREIEEKYGVNLGADVILPEIPMQA